MQLACRRARETEETVPSRARSMQAGPIMYGRKMYGTKHDALRGAEVVSSAEVHRCHQAIHDRPGKSTSRSQVEMQINNNVFGDQ